MFQTKDNVVNEIRYAGRSKAKVTDIDDPKKLGRIQVNHPLLGDTVWIPYLRMPHCYDVPDVDDVVYVECEAGYETHPVAWGNITKDKDSTIPDVFQRVSPTNKGFWTPDGHLIEFDDGSGPLKSGRGIRFTTSNGARVHIDAENDAIEMQSNFGDIISVSATDGVQAETPCCGGTTLSMKTGAVEITSAQAQAVLSALGDVELTGTGGSASIANTGDIEVKNNVASATMSATGDIEVANATSSLILTATGQVELKGAAAGVVDLLVQLLQALSTDAPPGFGSPLSNVATYAQLLTLAQSLKA